MKKNEIFFTFFLAIVACACRTERTAMTPDARSYIRACADSIDRIAEIPNASLPAFFYNPCLDYEKKYWVNIHKPLLIRKEIIDRVRNKEAIEYILTHGDRIITKKCGRQPNFGNGLVYYRIELLDKSFADLLKERLEKLGG